MKGDIEIAKQFLRTYGYSMVMVREWEEIVSRRKGLSPLVKILKNKPRFMDGASVACREAGVEAAAVLVEGNVKNVYVEAVSTGGLEMLERNGITVTYGAKTDNIREQSGAASFYLSGRRGKSRLPDAVHGAADSRPDRKC